MTAWFLHVVMDKKFDRFTYKITLFVLFYNIKRKMCSIIKTIG